MKRSILGIMILASLSCFAAEKVLPALSSVTSIFVSGNNQAAEKAREELQRGKTCFTLALKADAADAVLAIDADSQSTGPAGFGEFGQRNWVASGTLTLQTGELVWSHSERFSDAPFKSGGKVVGSLIVKRLARDTGCKNR